MRETLLKVAAVTLLCVINIAIGYGVCYKQYEDVAEKAYGKAYGKGVEDGVNVVLMLQSLGVKPEMTQPKMEVTPHVHKHWD